MFRTVTIACLLSLAVAGTARADFVFNDFSDTSNLTFNYDGDNAPASETTGPPEFELIVNDGSVGDQANAIWFNTKQSVAAGFETVFNWSHNNFDAAGFVIQNEGLGAVGGGGGDMGAAGIAPGLAVRIDRSGNVQLRDTTDWGTNLASGSSDAPDDGQVTISYDGSTLKVFDDGSEVLSHAIDLAPFADGAGNAYVGFTSGSGALTSDVLVADWTFVPEPTTLALFGFVGFAAVRRGHRRPV